jgi:hypothetical protein
VRPSDQWQRGLWGFNGLLFVPNSTDGTGGGLGAPWIIDAGVTVSHPAPTATSKATQIRRTMYTHDATNNRRCGPRIGSTADQAFWRGNSTVAPFLGGFYFAAVFTIEAWADDTGRIFAGLTAAASGVVQTDAVPVDTIGLWHSSVTGANTFVIATRDAGAESLVAFTAAANLVPGQGYLFEMWTYQATTGLTANIFCRLTNLNTGAKIASVQTNLGPQSATFLGPQVQMSNGAGASAGTPGAFAIGVANVLCTGQQLGDA